MRSNRGHIHTLFKTVTLFSYFSINGKTHLTFVNDHIQNLRTKELNREKCVRFKCFNSLLINVLQINRNAPFFSEVSAPLSSLAASVQRKPKK